MTKTVFRGTERSRWIEAMVELQSQFRRRGFGCWNSNPCVHINPNRAKRLPSETEISHILKDFCASQRRWRLIRSDQCSWCGEKNKPCIRFEFVLQAKS